MHQTVQAALELEFVGFGRFTHYLQLVKRLQIDYYLSI